MSMATAAYAPFKPAHACFYAQGWRFGMQYLHLRIAALFIILVTSTAGALFPVLLARRAQNALRSRVASQAWLNVAKYFGSGIILGTAFIHLLAPGIEALSSPCLPRKWREYPYALALCLSSILAMFTVEIISLRYASSRCSDPNGDSECGANITSDPDPCQNSSDVVTTQVEKPPQATTHLSASIISLVILEFGAILHSVLIGLTLAVDKKFKVLFAVLVVHQLFEGLGIGSRLALVRLPPRSAAFIPLLGAIVFGLSTPFGMAVGLAMHATYNTDDPGALAVSGVLDSLSSGILMYTALVEFFGRDILFNEELMTNGSVKELTAAVFWVFSGCFVMVLLGKWV